MPSPEDILESTTSRSKPLLALERLRRTRRILGDATTSGNAFGQPSGAGAGQPREQLRRGASRRRRGTGAVGMMDVFAVMAQINEQLGAAPDLDSFLKVVVGVIKDLTQFHRVLVYQFDELWNGQVVAELVDWKQTHELYRGLHFPASDIPAQVSCPPSDCGSMALSENRRDICTHSVSEHHGVTLFVSDPCVRQGPTVI